MGLHPKQIAAELAEGDLAAGAMLMALVAEPDLDIPKEDRGYLQQLEARGCVADGLVTPLGRQVAILLRRVLPADPLSDF